MTKSMKQTMNLRQVNWPVPDITLVKFVRTGQNVPMKLESVVEQMWIDQKTGEVEWREIESISAKQAGYLDDIASPDTTGDSTTPKG